MKNVIIVAKAGKNALTATDPNDFIFHSSYNTFKIVHQEKKAIAIPAGNNWIPFAHNSPLANTSCILIFLQFPDGKIAEATYAGFSESKSYNNAFDHSDGHSAGECVWDNTNIYLECGGVVTPYTINAVWYIFEPPL